MVGQSTLSYPLVKPDRSRPRNRFGDAGEGSRRIGDIKRPIDEQYDSVQPLKKRAPTLGSILQSTVLMMRPLASFPIFGSTDATCEFLKDAVEVDSAAYSRSGDSIAVCPVHGNK